MYWNIAVNYLKKDVISGHMELLERIIGESMSTFRSYIAYPIDEKLCPFGFERLYGHIYHYSGH